VTGLFLQTIREILLRPTTAFRNMKDDCPIKARRYFFRLLLVFALGRTSLAVMGIRDASLFPDPGQIPLPGWIFGSALMAFVLIIATILTGLFFLYFDTYIVNFMATLLGGINRNHTTFRVISYSATPALLFGWIPVIGIAGIIYSVILEIIGLQELRRLSLFRAGLALGMSIAVITSMAVVFFSIPYLLPAQFSGWGTLVCVSIVLVIMVVSTERELFCN